MLLVWFRTSPSEPVPMTKWLWIFCRYLCSTCLHPKEHEWDVSKAVSVFLGDACAPQFHYVALDGVDDELLCSVCTDPFVNPVVHDCGNTFCRACVTQTTVCPLCR